MGKMTATPNKTIDTRKYGRLLAKTLPRIIETQVENERMLAEVDKLMSRELSPEEGMLLDLMVKLIEDFEDKQYDFKATTPLEILKHFMDVRRVRPKELWPIIGSRSQTSDILSGRRDISKTVAKRLAEFFDVSPELFI
jgi:HTH-type transcriptional regulator/antitoxin HigA